MAALVLGCHCYCCCSDSDGDGPCFRAVATVCCRLWPLLLLFFVACEFFVDSPVVIDVVVHDEHGANEREHKECELCVVQSFTGDLARIEDGTEGEDDDQECRHEEFTHKVATCVLYF